MTVSISQSHPRDLSRAGAAAFTLIELLVVIAVIAILAAILFPVFGQTRVSARKVASLSNLKQISIGHLLYINDFDDVIIQQEYGSGDYQVEWSGMLYPYVRSGSPLVNSAGISGDGPAEGIFNSPGAPDDQAFPYGIHQQLAVDNYGTSTKPAFPASIVIDPSEQIFFMEKGRTEGPSGWPRFTCLESNWVTTLHVVDGVPTTDGNNIADSYDCDGPPHEMAQNPGCGQEPRFRYLGACPVAFFDGHVRGMLKGSIFFYKNIYSAAYPYKLD